MLGEQGAVVQGMMQHGADCAGGHWAGAGWKRGCIGTGYSSTQDGLQGACTGFRHPTAELTAH